VPWQPGLARIVCEGHVNGQPWPYDSRVMLKNRSTGSTRAAGPSTPGWSRSSRCCASVDGKIEPCDASDTLAKPCYDYKGLSRTRVFLERLSNALRATGIDVYQIDHEDANGQFEINYTYTDCADLLRPLRLLQDGGQRDRHDLGLICSFMPKPFANRPGNGMHMHCRSARRRTRKNLFEDKSDRAGWNSVELAYHFLGGLLAHAPALAALCAPTVNSYKRLVVGRSLTGAPGRRPTSATATTTARPWCASPRDGWNCACPTVLQPLPGHRGRHRRRPGRHRAPARPRRAAQRQPVRVERRRSCAGSRHRPAAAEPARRADALEGRRVMCRPGPGGRRVPEAQAHGMGRVHAPRLRLGNQQLPRVLLTSDRTENNHVWNRRAAGEEPALQGQLGELMVPMLIGMTERGPDSAGWPCSAAAARQGSASSACIRA
jgi:hypothetical protein